MSSVLYRAPKSHYPVAVRAEGMYIEDREGKRYLDMSGGAAVSCLGHSHPDVVRAVREQVGTLDFAHTAFFTHEPQERLAEVLAQRFGDERARVYFTSGGSEANETALKLAWQYWAARGEPERQMIVSRVHSYHGNTFGTLSVSGNGARRRASAAPLLDWPRISPFYPYRGRRDGESVDDYAARTAGELETVIAAEGAERIAAFICEPVVGSSLGVVAADGGYLRRIRDICDRHGILLLADEIMCGSGRTGTFFAHEQDGIRPDVVTLAKGIAGGSQALAATVMSGQVASVLEGHGFAHGHTYIGHPVACAAGLAVQDVLARDGLLERARILGARFLSRLRDHYADHPHVGEVRGRGLFVGIELVSDRETKAGFDDGRQLPDALRRAGLESGLVCYPGGIEVDGRTVPHIMLAPPMIAEDIHLESCVERLDSVLTRVLPTRQARRTG